MISRLAFGFALLFALNVAQGADWVIRINPATTNTDGSVIPATGPGSFVSHRAEYGSCSGTAFGVKAGDVTALASAATVTIPNLGPGTYCSRLYSRNTYGVESVASIVLTKTFAPPQPNPPSPVTVDTMAYDIRSGGTLAAEVGRIALGIACGAETKIVNGVVYHRVPFNVVDFVVWQASKRSADAWARCG